MAPTCLLAGRGGEHATGRGGAFPLFLWAFDAMTSPFVLFIHKNR